MSDFEPNYDQLLKAAIRDLEHSSDQTDVPISQTQITSKPSVGNSNSKNKPVIVIITLIILISLVGLFVNYYSTEHKSNNEYESTCYQNYTEKITDSDSRMDNKEYIEIENLAANEIADLYDNLGLKNPIQCFYAYCILLEENHFSKGEFKCSDNNLCDYEYVLGYDVLLGKGTCRHIDDLFRLSMTKAGYDIKSTTTYFCENSLSAVKYDEANHQVSIINDNDNIYVLDVTNVVVSDNYSNELAIYYDYDGNLYNCILPEYSIYENGYLVSYNTQNDVDLINEWMASDTESLDVEFINSQKQEVYDLLNTSSAKKVIRNFDLDYNNNVLLQIN